MMRRCLMMCVLACVSVAAQALPNPLADGLRRCAAETDQGKRRRDRRRRAGIGAPFIWISVLEDTILSNYQPFIRGQTATTSSPPSTTK